MPGFGQTDHGDGVLTEFLSHCSLMKYWFNHTYERFKAAFNNNATALWRPSWWESATAGHNFGRGPFNDYSIKVWF
jgi:hypothetical protein